MEAKCVDSDRIAENSSNATEVLCTIQNIKDSFGHQVSRPPSAGEAEESSRSRGSSAAGKGPWEFVMLHLSPSGLSAEAGKSNL